MATGDQRALALFRDVAGSAAARLSDFDTGFWSLYEQSGMRMKMLASPFYHRLHIAQLEVSSHRQQNFRKFRAQMERLPAQRVEAWVRVPA